MNRTRKIIISILIVVMIGLVALISGAIFLGQNSHLTSGERNILVCAIDESEIRAGMGACDMAFIVTLDNGTLKTYAPVYPSGLTHPNASEPTEYQKQGAGPHLLLHDSFYDADNSNGMRLAKEIVEYNTNVTIDNVVAINCAGLDAILHAAGPLDIHGVQTNASGMDIIREETNNQGVSRGDAVMDIVRALVKKASDPDIKSAMINAAVDQYSKGNIIMDQQGDFVGLLASKGMEKLLG